MIEDSRRLRVVFQSVRAPLTTKIARRRTATRQTFALVAAQRILSYFILIKIISGRRRAQPQRNMAIGVELRIMPSDDEGHWYWEVIKDEQEVVARGVANTEPAACEQADEAARKAKLIA